MNILIYNDLNTARVQKLLDKLIRQLQNDDFAGAEVKKMHNTGYYRAKLDYEHRLLFRFARHEKQTYILLLEVILNHNYHKSRFLRGAEIDETKLVPLVQYSAVPADDVVQLSFVNHQLSRFHLLDKVLSLDNDQQAVFALPTPVIIIGSAGSGKTALTLEKMKQLNGNILYVTLSDFLVKSAANLYYAYHYENEQQEVNFLSFKDYVQTLRIPAGKELSFREFDAWVGRYRNSSAKLLRDSYKVFEEFRGVITGNDTQKAYLSRADYMQLGVRQSVFDAAERELVYDLFERYVQFLGEQSYYDLNMIAYQWQQYVQPLYDFVVVDEVQDLTNTQLYLILKSLKKTANFMLCGDSNQIVHPNFFSWSNVKSLFYKTDMATQAMQLLRINYRNSPQVTHLANTLLKVKHLRFGSIDRESTYLVESVSEKQGEVGYLQDTTKVRSELNQKTRHSTQYAVIVLSAADKVKARAVFQTPLLFTVQEAKGLEYENVILLNLVSDNAAAFAEICDGVSANELSTTQELSYGRAKDKTDKALEVYKFYVNSLYVAFTRAIGNLYIVESNAKHPLLHLLELQNSQQEVRIKEQKSSLDDWKREAQKLEQQGKTEQADLIKQNILHLQSIPWTPITAAEVVQLRQSALDPDNFNKKAKDNLFEYALIYRDTTIFAELAQLKYRRADHPDTEYASLYRKHYPAYRTDDLKALMPDLNRYGIDYCDRFNYTPLMAAAQAGSLKIAQFLTDNNAHKDALNNKGHNSLQICIMQAHVHADYRRTKLGSLFEMLCTDSISIKVDDQLVKIHQHTAEFLLLNLFIALQQHITEPKRNPNWRASAGRAIEAGDLVAILDYYPNYLVPDYRRARAYISSILSKNELKRNDKYNKKIFLRLSTGNYALNPRMELRIDDQWKNVYQLLGIPPLYPAAVHPNFVYAAKKYTTADMTYDMPTQWLIDHEVPQHRFNSDYWLTAQIINRNPELRKVIVYGTTAKDKRELTRTCLRCRMPAAIGGGEVLVDVTDATNYLSVAEGDQVTVAFAYHTGKYAYAYLFNY